jgi:hypothetical protein
MRAVDSDKTFFRAPPEARVRRTFFLLTSTYIEVGDSESVGQIRTGKSASGSQVMDNLGRKPGVGSGEECSSGDRTGTVRVQPRPHQRKVFTVWRPPNCRRD